MTSPRFFSVSHNSSYTRGFPWIRQITSGFRQTYWCKRCPRSLSYADGPIEVVCEESKGTKWADYLGCGHFPFAILSGRAIRALSEEGVGDLPVQPVLIRSPLPKKLASAPPPDYFWLDGKRMRGALLDFDASGYVDVKFCPECGTRTDDILATGARRRSAPYPCAFRPGTWNGDHLFTTDLSHCAFFCTERVLECARKHRLTNFRFIAAEDGFQSGHKGIEYL